MLVPPYVSCADYFSPPFLCCPGSFFFFKSVVLIHVYAFSDCLWFASFRDIYIFICETPVAEIANVGKNRPNLGFRRLHFTVQCLLSLREKMYIRMEDGIYLSNPFFSFIYLNCMHHCDPRHSK